MFDTLFPVLLGGFLAIIGGAIQSYLSIHTNARTARIGKREEAYLGYIEALMKIEVRESGVVKTDNYWNKFQIVQAKLRLYSSKNILNLEKEFADALYECWECNCDVVDINGQKDKLLNAMRKELHVD